MKKKNLVLAMVTAAFALGTTFVSLAGWEQNGQGWQYKGDSTGEYFVGGTQWIDGNGDGIFERYHFDEEGYLITNSTDTYEVNADGMELANGQPRTVDMAQFKEGMNNGFIRKEYLDLLACDKSAVDKALGAPSIDNTSFVYYNAPDGNQIYAEYDEGGRLVLFRGYAEVLCAWAKDSYTLDELDANIGIKRTGNFMPTWRYQSEISMSFAYGGARMVLDKDDYMELRISLQ